MTDEYKDVEIEKNDIDTVKIKLPGFECSVLNITENFCLIVMFESQAEFQNQRSFVITAVFKPESISTWLLSQETGNHFERFRLNP